MAPPGLGFTGGGGLDGRGCVILLSILILVVILPIISFPPVIYDCASSFTLLPISGNNFGIPVRIVSLLVILPCF